MFITSFRHYLLLWAICKQNSHTVCRFLFKYIFTMFHKNNSFIKLLLNFLTFKFLMYIKRKLPDQYLLLTCFSCFRLPFYKLPYNANPMFGTIFPTGQNRHQLVFVPYNPLVIQYLLGKSSHRRVKQGCVRKMEFVGGWRVGEWKDEAGNGSEV